jgi:hypothetical protein
VESLPAICRKFKSVIKDAHASTNPKQIINNVRKTKLATDVTGIHVLAPVLRSANKELEAIKSLTRFRVASS